MTSSPEHNKAEEFEKDEAAAEKGGLKLVPKGKCNNPKEPWVGLSAEQRKKLGVKLNDQVELHTAEDGEALGTFTVVKGKKDVFEGDEKAFSANVHKSFIGKELLVKKAANTDEEDEGDEETAVTPPPKKTPKKEAKPAKAVKPAPEYEEEEPETEHEDPDHAEKPSKATAEKHTTTADHDKKHPAKAEGHDKAAHKKEEGEHPEAHGKKGHGADAHDKAHDSGHAEAHDKGHSAGHGSGHGSHKPFLERVIGDGPREGFETRVIKKAPGAVKKMCGYFSQLIRGTVRGAVSMPFRAVGRFITEPFKHLGRTAKNSWNILKEGFVKTREYNNVGKISPVIRAIVLSTTLAVANVTITPFMPVVGAATAVAEDSSTIISAIGGKYGERAKLEKATKLTKKKAKLEKQLEMRKKELEEEIARLSGSAANSDHEGHDKGAAHHDEHEKHAA